MNRRLTDYNDVLVRLHGDNRLRTLVHSSEADMVDCTSNDYMGISRNAELRRVFTDIIGAGSGWGSCASRLLYTGADCYAALENLLQTLYGREALLFNSGYHANTGIIPALALPGTLIVADKLVHASIIDGIRLSGVPFARFRHNDVSALKRILEKEGGSYRRILVVVESVYSMDGDCAPLRQLAALRSMYPTMLLYVDEAHAFGVAGSRGLGLAEQTDTLGDIDILVATLSKATASAGAFVITDTTLKDYLVNTARSLIFSTALPPASVAWSQFVVGRMVEMQEARTRLAAISREISTYVAKLTGSGQVGDTPIIPVMLGSNDKVMAASSVMKRCGVLALPIRRPTVAAGTERLRISLNAAMTDSDVARVKEAVRCVYEEVMS